MKKQIFLSAIMVIAFFGCKKTDTKAPIKAQTFEVKSTSSTVWKYFSFATNDTVTITDPANSTGWDLAFQRYRIRTNGGLSGNGSGSAANSYQKGQTGFDAISVVSDTSTFINDASISIAVQQGYATYICLLYTSDAADEEDSV